MAKLTSEGTGIEVHLRFDDRISGPLPGDANPFADGTADMGFVCSPTYKWLRNELHLLPVPVSGCSVHAALLGAHVRFGEELRSFGFVRFAEAEREAYAN